MNHCSRSWLFLCAVMLAACSSAEDSRPRSLEDDVATPVVADRGPGGHPTICIASTFRECKLTWIDANGQLNCPTSYQFCNEDGTDWFDCGEFDTGEDGEPVPPKNPSKPKRNNGNGGSGNSNGNSSNNGNGSSSNNGKKP